jgi:hypothetical protein
MFTLRGVVVRGGTDRTADQLRARVALLERRLMELERSTLPVLADPLRPLNAGAFTGERSEVELPLDPRQMRR